MEDKYYLNLTLKNSVIEINHDEKENGEGEGQGEEGEEGHN